MASASSFSSSKSLMTASSANASILGRATIWLLLIHRNNHGNYIHHDRVRRRQHSDHFRPLCSSDRAGPSFTGRCGDRRCSLGRLYKEIRSSCVSSMPRSNARPLLGVHFAIQLFDAAFSRSTASLHWATIGSVLVCTENLSSGVAVVKSAQDGA